MKVWNISEKDVERYAKGKQSKDTKSSGKLVKEQKLSEIHTIKMSYNTTN